MLAIQKNVALKAFNTLALPCVAKYYVSIDQVQQIPEVLEYAAQQHLNVMLLSGGSNVLLPDQINALVLHMQLGGIETLTEDTNHIWLRVAAGEIWHDFVCTTTKMQAYGLQNLALIPGKVGASPVQNIGAYGVEVGDFIDYVEVYDRVEKCFKRISAEDCHFSYRHSIFKDDPTRYIITHVVFKLLKTAQLKMDYGDLKHAMGDELTAENLQQQVIQIRQSKLPQPSEYPNVGSFFKNPIVPKALYEHLLVTYPQAPAYAQPNDQVKLAAGWLIDQSGWKGKRLGQVGMFHKQALVLVNYDKAHLADVQRTYRAVQSDVQQKFGIELEPEPVLYAETGAILPHSVRFH